MPLSSQELRQVLNRGDFANYLIETTNELIPLHSVLNLDGPDTRLRDAEILLRYISFSLYGSEYTGNLTPFLDSKMNFINENWADMHGPVEALTQAFNDATTDLIAALDRRVGRKFTEKGWETRFNRALYEVEVYYAARMPAGLLAGEGEKFQEAFEALCMTRPEFIDSIETSTKNIDKYFTRFTLFREMVNETFDLKLEEVPVPRRA